LTIEAADVIAANIPHTYTHNGTKNSKINWEGDEGFSSSELKTTRMKIV
jgi:hypothetical protein